jgi:hypothetical protein
MIARNVLISRLPNIAPWINVTPFVCAALNARVGANDEAVINFLRLVYDS